MNAIKTRSLSKFFYNGEIKTTAVKDANINIEKGSFTIIFGKSGSGKSTLLGLISGLDDASSGSIEILGFNVKNFSVKETAKFRSKRLGYIFQSFNLISDMNIFDNITLPAKYLGVDKSIYEQACLRISRELNIDHRLKHFPNQLSGGQQQRVAIARSIINNPEVLFVDEATGNLDSENSAIVIDKLQYLNKQGVTIIMVTHEREYLNYADHIIHMKDGVILTTEALD